MCSAYIYARYTYLRNRQIALNTHLDIYITRGDIPLQCRICKKKTEHTTAGMCDECFYLYSVIMKTNSSEVKEATLERILKILKADYEGWSRQEDLKT